MKNIKMIAFDLDGTLLTNDKKITQHTKEVLLEAARKGIEILPSTGRPLAGLPPELVRLQGIRYAVTANGARIVELESKKTIYEKPVPVEKARKLLDIFGEYDAMREIYYDGIGYSDGEKMRNIMRYAPDEAMAEYIVTTRIAVDDIEEKFRKENREVDKVQALFASMEERKEALKKVRQVEGVEATGSLVNNIEVNAEGVNKGEALICLGEKLGIRREEIAAFGDGANDREMLHQVGTGVAMANAVPEIREAADYITTSNEEDGVAVFIERYILERQ